MKTFTVPDKPTFPGTWAVAVNNPELEACVQQHLTDAVHSDTRASSIICLNGQIHLVNPDHTNPTGELDVLNDAVQVWPAGSATRKVAAASAEPPAAKEPPKKGGKKTAADEVLTKPAEKGTIEVETGYTGE